MLDLLISRGTVVDGTGGPPAGPTSGYATARWWPWAASTSGPPPSSTPTGCTWRPGFVDLHTHYDAQLFWDPAASPSPLPG